MIAASLAASLRSLAHLETLTNIVLDPGDLVAWIFAGLLAGWLAGLVVRGRGFGCLGNIAIGLIGAFVGALILSFLPVTITGISGFVETLVVAFLGALLLLALGRLIGGSRRPRYPTPPYQPPRGPYQP